MEFNNSIFIKENLMILIRVLSNDWFPRQRRRSGFRNFFVKVSVHLVYTSVLYEATRIFLISAWELQPGQNRLYFYDPQYQSPLDKIFFPLWTSERIEKEPIGPTWEVMSRVIEWTSRRRSHSSYSFPLQILMD